MKMLTSAIFRGEMRLWVAGGADLTASFNQCARLKRLLAAVVFAACQVCFIFGSAQIVTQSRVPDQMPNEVGFAQPSVASSVAIGTPAVHDTGVKRTGLDQISKLDASVDSLSAEKSLRRLYGSNNRDAAPRSFEDSSDVPVDNHLFPPPFPGSFAHDPAVEVKVYDYVGLKDASLQRLTSVVQEILRGAGIFAHVDPCTQKTEPSCQRAEGASNVYR